MIYIIANSKATSGGPELLHQLCFELKRNGFDSAMVYFSRFKFGTEKTSDEIKKRYGKYDCNIATRIIDIPENTVVIPETMTFFLPRIKKAKKVIWWQSVDNYYCSLTSKYAKLYAPLGMNGEKFNSFRENIYHGYQSEYARQFLLEKGVKEGQIFSLSDYINEDLIKSVSNEFNNKKDKVVLYNPRKGMEYTEQIIRRIPEISWLPLSGFAPGELSDILTHSKVYIDFGNHPGKDRIPREAALGGCCIIVGKRGSAVNDIDVPIPGLYKFNMEKFDVKNIGDRILDCINNYDDLRGDFDLYREKILREKSVFIKEVIDFGNKFK